MLATHRAVLMVGTFCRPRLADLLQKPGWATIFPGMSFPFLVRTIMKRTNISHCAGLLCAGLMAMVLAACETTPAAQPAATPATPATPVVTAARPTTPAPAPTPAAALPTIRVKAGADADLKDSKGNTWKADTGFEGGSTIDRPDLKVTGTDIPEIYCSEHYSMDSWSTKVPNGKYVLKLHFSEDYDGISDANGRIFDYTVKDGDANTGIVVKKEAGFGPWKKAGAQYKAVVESVPVTVTKGQITVVFTPNVENPQINAIEVAPQ
jgi:hypothetical protein